MTEVRIAPRVMEATMMKMDSENMPPKANFLFVGICTFHNRLIGISITRRVRKQLTENVEIITGKIRNHVHCSLDPERKSIPVQSLLTITCS